MKFKHGTSRSTPNRVAKIAQRAINKRSQYRWDGNPETPAAREVRRLMREGTKA